MPRSLIRTFVPPPRTVMGSLRLRAQATASCTSATEVGWAKKSAVPPTSQEVSGANGNFSSIFTSFHPDNFAQASKHRRRPKLEEYRLFSKPRQSSSGDRCHWVDIPFLRVELPALNDLKRFR